MKFRIKHIEGVGYFAQVNETGMVMSKEQMLMYTMKGMINELPQESKDRINECAEKLRGIRKEYGDDGIMAFSLVSLEIVSDE